MSIVFGITLAMRPVVEGISSGLTVSPSLLIALSYCCPPLPGPSLRNWVVFISLAEKVLRFAIPCQLPTASFKSLT